MNIEELIKWHEEYESLTFNIGDVVIHEGRKCIVLYVNPYKDTYEKSYHLWLIDIECRDRVGAYFGEAVHDPNDEKLLGRVLNEVDNDDTTYFFSLYKYTHYKYACDFNKNGDVIAVEIDTVDDGDSKLEVLLLAWKMKIEANIKE